jgi:uridine kinase
VTPSLPAAARVILLTGPSGSGKSSLAALTGLPVLRLDDFYLSAHPAPSFGRAQQSGGSAAGYAVAGRGGLAAGQPAKRQPPFAGNPGDLSSGDKEGDDPPSPPLLPNGSGIDWDSPKSWDADAAVAAIESLAHSGEADIPVYDIAASARAGTQLMILGGARLFVAEGIFAADIVARCRELGLLADALCLSRGAVTTARRRFVRDLREGRKSVRFLVRRGWSLMRAERAIVERHAELGAHVCGRNEALERIRCAGRVPEPEPVAPVAVEA